MVLLTDLQAPVRLQAILLQTKDWRILPPKLSLFSYVYPGVTVREYQSPCLWYTPPRMCPRVLEEGSFQGVLRGESAGENPLALFVVLRFVFAYGIP